MRDDGMVYDGPSLVARHLTRSFGSGETRTTALHDVSLDLHSGEFVMLMGPSGSGKSTLLAVLSGLLRPDSGQVCVLGQDIWRQTEQAREMFRRRHCGFIFQGYNLFPALTARQQLEIVLRWGDDVPAADARARSDAMLDVLGLAQKKLLRPAQLSGGEKQRVAIGRGLGKRPTVCLGDGAARRPVAAAQRPARSTRDAEKLVVCFGYADLEAGVTNLHPSQVGRVEEVLVRENDSVAAGAVLLRLDDRAARFKVEEAKAV